MDHAVIHVDMNSFYASVEQAENPCLKGRPLVVAGKEELRHGIVLTKSIEAKKYGIKTAETLRDARKKCPDLLVLPPNYPLYKYYSKVARDIYYSYTDLVEPFGLDECWIDITGSLRLHGISMRKIAEEISEQIKAELGVTVSIGLGWDKATSKFGSDYKKPDAITEITRSNYKDIFWPAPVGDLIYVGHATEKKLYSSGITTIGDLANTSDYYLQNTFKKIGFMLRSLARGEYISPVKPYNPTIQDVDRGRKSYSNGLTAPHDITCPNHAKALIYKLVQSVAQNLREDYKRAKTISIGVRSGIDLSGYSRQTTLFEATASTSKIARTAYELLTANQPLDEAHPIRMLSVRASNLTSMHDPFQLSFFNEDYLMEDLDFAIDSLRGRFGNTCIMRGIELIDETLADLDIKTENTVHPIGFLHV